jgi:hypothetical protein
MERQVHKDRQVQQEIQEDLKGTKDRKDHKG